MAERYLIGVIMPCMCVMSPSRIAYDRIQLLLTLFKEKAPEVYFGTNPVEFLHTDVWLRRLLHDAADPQAPYRAPHDKLRSKELESLFAQSLKRLTSRNVCRYRCLLRPAIYANPLFVAEKMFQQSVGYNNNFLLIHTQLLSGAPPAIMTLIAHVGLHHMRHYANTERFGTADGCRVACIASFLAVLWRDNPRSFDGELLLRAAEYALRRESRAAVVMGLETLRAVLHELMDTKLEHEEKFSAQQLKALMAPSRTQWFAKGAAESFRRVRWDSLFTPAVLATSAAQLQSVLQQPCEVAVEQEDEEGEEEGEGGYKEATETSSAAASCDGIKKEDDEGNEEMILSEATAGHLREKGLAPPVMELTLGQAILLHLCRLHSRIYDIQADIAAPMQLLLLTCARDYNVINDLLLCVEKLLLQGPPVEEICMVAMPHIALHLAARFAAKKKIIDMRNQQQIQQTSAEGKTPNTKSGDSYQHAGVVDAAFILTPSEVMECFEDTPLWKSICGSISVSLIQQLSCHTGAHFVFDESVYAAAGKELNHYFSSEMSKMKAKAGKSSEAINASMQKNPSFRWMQGQTRYMWREKDAHRKLHQKCAATLSSLLNDMRSGGVFNKPVEFATTYLLPRALISLEDTLFVSHFLRWMLDNTEGEERQCVVDIILSLVTSAATFFVGLTDGECMRIGCLFSFLLTLEKDFAMETLGGTAVVDSAGATAKDSQETTSTPTYQPPSITSEALRTHLDPAPRPLLAILTALSKDEEEGKNEEEKEKVGKDENHERNGTSQSDYTKVPAYPLQLEAFLCRTFVQVLVHQWDVQFLHRNALLVLERLTKNMSLFPSTLCTTEWLISAVSPHAVKSSSSYASATAVLKTLNENYRRCQELVKQPEQSCVAENKKVKAWLKFLKDREVYVYSLLSVDMAASEKKLHEKKAATSHNFAPQNDERDDTDEENEDEGAASRPSQSEGEEANEDLHGSEGTTDDDGKSDDMSDARSSSAGDNRDGSRNDGGSDSGNEERGHETQGEGAEEEMVNEEASQKLAENDPRINSGSSGHRTPSSIGGSEKKSRKRGREEAGDESS
uniref:Uncharacterized protein TCIL3000_1_1070 n=1 Tax=Trypanosoma congolense (strain IL3000) TaxID=1068625 RepID=G0UIY9_TRYCI|nr:unnamed protein product [Trypanosoma congolense IL3000]